MECSLPESQKLCLEITVLARIAECLELKISFSCHLDLIVNQICRLKDVAWLERPQLIFLIFRTFVCKFCRVEGAARKTKLQTND